MAAFLAKSPETRETFEVRHFQIECDSVEHGQLVYQLDALCQARRGGNADIRIRFGKMARGKVTTETVLVSQKKAHARTPLPATSVPGN